MDLQALDLLVQGVQTAGSLTGHCMSGRGCHLEVLQPLGIDLQAVPVLVQGEQVNITNALLLFLQQ